MKNDITLEEYAPRTLSELRDRLAYVRAYAPDEFPQFSWKKPEHQNNLETSFFLLNYSLDMVCSTKKFKDMRSRLEGRLNDAKKAYEMGNRREGIDLLYAFEEMLFGAI